MLNRIIVRVFIMSEKKSLFVQDGNIFTPTSYAHGPWGAHLVHGGSTGGLMACVLEQCEPNPDRGKMPSDSN